jgi:hypothetical protein
MSFVYRYLFAPSSSSPKPSSSSDPSLRPPPPPPLEPPPNIHRYKNGGGSNGPHRQNLRPEEQQQQQQQHRRSHNASNVSDITMQGDPAVLQDDNDEEQQQANERTSLLGAGGRRRNQQKDNDDDDENNNHDLLHEKQQQPQENFVCCPCATTMKRTTGKHRQPQLQQQKTNPTVQEFFFNYTTNPSIQRYYRFESTNITPIAALYKRPGLRTGVTGVLRRSAVVPSHGTDGGGSSGTNTNTNKNDNEDGNGHDDSDGNGNGSNNNNGHGEYILISVGGRSGWAPRHARTFTPARSFRASEAWMGNHAFLCKGKIMLGSDAPSLALSLTLIVAGTLIQLLDVVPTLRNAVVASNDDTDPEDEGTNNDDNANHDEPFWWQPQPHFPWILWTTHLLWGVSLAVSLATIFFLLAAALTDPGILPSVSSPVKAIPPVDEHGTALPLGGPNIAIAAMFA